MKKGFRRVFAPIIAILFALSLTFISLAMPASEAKAENVIILIGDGMGFGQMTAARIYKGAPLCMDEFSYTGFVSTYPDDPVEKWVTDSAAAGTAIAAGVKTYNAAISVDGKKRPVKTILEYAQEHGKATGLVTTTRITHATPAVFAAHNPNRDAEDEIAADILAHNVTVLLGGGSRHFLPTNLKGKRTDGLNLVERAKSMGYRYVETAAEMAAVSSGKLLGLFKAGHMSYEIDRPATEPSLAQMTQKALELLDDDPDGFFLMLEGGRIDHACHAHDGAAAIRDTLAFDEAVRVAFTYALRNRDTLVIVTADHETGGLSVGGYGQYCFNPEVLRTAKASFEDVIGPQLNEKNFQELLARYYGITDLTPEEIAAVRLGFEKKAGAIALADVVSRRALLGWTSTAHTGNDVPIMAYGPFAEFFTGRLDNTEIFEGMMAAFGFR